MTAQQPFRQSADPLSKNSRNSRNFGEWVCSLADEPTGHHYTLVHTPTQAVSNNQADHTHACYQMVLHHLAGHYTSSEMVQCSLTGAMGPNWCRAARHGSLTFCWSNYRADLAARRLVAQ